ncbi:hypothetical protein GRI40_01710 [Altererythrobacter aerius]|uniref:TIGR02588 family protein n=1 Tax=Tsuneonella aeria TaxID=1837929 RepID=A0A6I4TCQ7_9SPHN|nr:hypothetical protein [Tsuneonella aeria]MXO73940.1 hypothetical protein [Tsuneonella aeria]
MKEDEGKHDRLPPLAILAGSIGLLLTVGLVGFIGWEATRQEGVAVPVVVVEAGDVTPTGGGYVVEFEARNLSGRTAANVEIEASLELAGEPPVVSTVALDYVPAHSKHNGGVFLPADPRTGTLEMRVLGYAEP